MFLMPAANEHEYRQKENAYCKKGACFQPTVVPSSAALEQPCLMPFVVEISNYNENQQLSIMVNRILASNCYFLCGFGHVYLIFRICFF